jgi:hypothetical protein
MRSEIRKRNPDVLWLINADIDYVPWKLKALRQCARSAAYAIERKAKAEQEVDKWTRENDGIPF